VRLLGHSTELSWPEWITACEAWAFLTGTTVALRLIGFGTVKKRLLGFGSRAQGRVDLASAQKLARIVSGAARWSAPRPSCLPRAIVLCRLLRRRGMEGVLHLGVDRAQGAFSAHAWVEHGGVALGEAEMFRRQYKSLGPLNSATPTR
jgi:hypothetical protein